MDSGQKPTVPIMSTAGAVPVKTDKGKQKLKNYCMIVICGTYSRGIKTLIS